MFSGPCSIPDGVVWALYGDASDLAYVVWVTWHESCVLQPPTPTVRYDNSLVNGGIYSFVILIIYLLVGTWGCYGGCVFVGSGSLFSILFCVELWT